MRFDIITIFPDMMAGFLSGGVAKKALERGLLEVFVHDLRDYTHDRHKQVDDRPFGGGEGMVLKPEPIFEAVEAVRKNKRSRVFLLSPQGARLDSALARKLSRVPRCCGQGGVGPPGLVLRWPSRLPALYPAAGFSGNEGPPGAFLGKSC